MAGKELQGKKKNKPTQNPTNKKPVLTWTAQSDHRTKPAWFTF